MESFRKKILNEAEEITRLKMGLGTNTLPSIFSADLLKVYRTFFIVYVRDFYTVAFGCGER